MRRGFGFTGFGLDRAGKISDPLTFASPPVGAPVAWWDFTDMAMTDAVNDGDPITFWRDKTSNQIILNASGAARPTLKIVGGKPFARFAGSQVMTAADAIFARVTGDLTIIMAAYKPDYGVTGCIIACQTNLATKNQYELRYTNHASVIQPEVVHASDAANEQMQSASNSTFAEDTWFTSAFRRTGTTAFKFYGATSDSGVPTITPTSDASSIFYMGNRKSSGMPLTGDIACVLIYASALSDADVGTARTYAAARY